MNQKGITNVLENKKQSLFSKAKAKYYALNVLLMTLLMSNEVYANAAGKTKGILDPIVGLFPAIGGFFLASGGLKLILAYRNDQPEAQTGAAKDIVIGIALILFKTLLWTNVLKPMIG